MAFTLDLTLKIFRFLLGSLCEKCANTEFFSGPYVIVFRLNTGKNGPEKTHYLDIFHAVITMLSSQSLLLSI